MILRLAHRNLWRNSRRTLLTLSAMGTATGLLIFSLSYLNGLLTDMIESATALGDGHAKITAPGYLASHRLARTLPETPPALTGARGWAGRVRGFALLSAGRGADARTQPAEILGIDPVEESRVTRLHERVIEGAYLPQTDSRDLVLGSGLARRLRARPGDEIVVMAQAADGGTAADLWRVVGVVDTGDSARDSALVLVGRRALQETLALNGRVHEWAVRLDRPRDAPRWVAAQKTDAQRDITPWTVLLPQLADVLRFSAAARILYAVIFYFAVVLVAANTLTTAVFERTHEFGVLGALGLGPGRRLALVVTEGALLGLWGAAWGGLLGGAAGWYFDAHPWPLNFARFSWAGASLEPRIRTVLAAGDFVWAVALMAVLGAGIAALPGWRVARLRPVDALRAS